MNSRIYIIIGGLLIIIVALVFWWTQDPVQKELTNWEYTLNKDDEGPYGLYAFHQLLEDYNQGHEYVEIDQDFLLLDNYDVEDQQDIYFFAGIENHYRQVDWDKLSNFVRRGNVAFMAVDIPAYQVIDDVLSGIGLRKEEGVYVQLIPDDFKDTTQTFTLSKKRMPPYTFQFIYEDSLMFYNFSFIENKDYIEVKKLGYYENNELNYIAVDYGKGTFYIHTAPVVFSNISIFNEEGLVYAENVLSYLPHGNVIWDEVSKAEIQEERVRETSPLHLITSNPPLLWAYITFLSLLILYLVFRSKRKFPVIPAREEKKNTSLDFIDVISNIHFKQNNHKKLMIIKEKTFRHFIKDKYFMEGDFEDEKFIERLTRKSALDPEKVKMLLNSFVYLKAKPEVTEEQLIELHKKIEYFYKNCL